MRISDWSSDVCSSDLFGVPRERVATKTRARGKGGSKYAQSGAGFGPRGESFVVREGEARLRVNLFDYLDTGLFLDHRPLRQRIFREARGRRFLNLFCYTGAATVQARSEEHTSELQSLMRISYAVFCLKKKKHTLKQTHN